MASEGTDIELELLDFARVLIKNTYGNVAIGEGWEVTRISQTEILIKPGEAWFEGLPFLMRGGKDQLVSGSALALGTVDLSLAGTTDGAISVSDDSTGLGKILSFDNTIGSGDYRIIIAAREEVITTTDDLFLQNANLSETTSQKLRLNYRISVVPASYQTTSPIPYTNHTTDGNLTNSISVTPSAGGNGELVGSTSIAGSETIDGRDLELTIRNDVALGGGNPIPNGTTDQLAFFNGKLIDSVGTEYHLNAVFNDTVATQVILRVDKEFGQPDPQIVVGTPFQLIKKEPLVTDDSSGTPQGIMFWDIADVTWNITNGITHASKVADLRNTITDFNTHQQTVDDKFDLILTEGGDIAWDSSTSALTWSSALTLVNPHGPEQSITAGAARLIDGASLVYGMDLATGGAIEVGTFAVASVSSGTSIVLTGAPDLSTIKVGNIIADDNGGVAAITAIDDVTDTLTVSTSLTFTSAGTIYRDAYAAGTAPSSLDTYVLGTRKGTRVYLGGGLLELESGETSQIGDGISSQLLTYLGATGEDDSDPSYSNVAIVTQGDSLTTGIGKLDAALEDTNTYVGSTGPGDTDPNYSNTAVVTQGEDLTLAVGDLDAAVEAANTYAGSTGPTDTDPNYTSTNTVVQGSPLTTAISALDAGSSVARDGKMIGGGTFSWDSGSSTLTSTASAFLQYGGVADDRNEITASSWVINANEVAYVDINTASPGIAGTIAISTVNIDSFVSTSNRIIVARRDSSDILVGTGSIRLKDGEYLELDGASSELHRKLDQLVLDFTDNANEVELKSSDITQLDGSIIVQEIGGILIDMAADTIDFTTGTAATATVAGLGTITTSIPTDNHYRWFGLALETDVIAADNRTSVSILVTPGSATDAVQGNAPYPTIAGTRKLGAVLVQRVGAAAVITEIRPLGPGAGGSGSGDGNANAFLETIKNMLNDSTYEFVTPNIFRSAQDSLVTLGGTAAYSQSSKNMSFPVIADSISSVQMLDDDFLDESKDVRSVQLAAKWDASLLDDLATYEVSRDGGNEYQTITMERIGASDTYVGSHEFDTEAADQTIVTQASVTGTQDLDITSNQKLSQSFVLSATTILRELDLTVTVAGSPVGYMTVQIVNDSASLPSTSSADILAETQVVDISAMSTGTISVTLPDTVLVAGTYHVVVRTDAAYATEYNTSGGSNSIALSLDSAADGMSTFDGAVWADSATNALTHTLKGRELDLRVRITSGTTDVELEGYGVFYDLQTSGISTGTKNRQAFRFDTLTNPNEFTLTQFLPDPDLLEVYLVNTGQVFKAPSFTLDGSKVVFPVNTFDNGGIAEDFTLIFEMLKGHSFDNSDQNALLMAGNFLGSTDASIDRSVDGRGIFLRRPDGTLREITIDDSDNIVVYSV